MTYVLLGLNILIIMAVWHFMLKRTLLDHARDKLFDLRDEMRGVYLERGWGLDAASYGNLRAMINAYLRYTEVHSIWRLISVRAELSMQDRAELRKYLAVRIGANFNAGNEEQLKYIADVRRRASNALTDFAVYNSGLLLLLTVFVTPVFLIVTFADQCRKGMAAMSTVLARDALHLGRVAAFVWSRSTRWVAAKVADQQSLEVTISNEAHKFA